MTAGDTRAYRLPDEPRRHARERGSSLALTDGARSVTYAELDARTNRIAQAMLAAGASAGERIAVLDKSSVEVVEVVLATAKIGAVAVPLNWRLAVGELRAVLDDADTGLLFCGPEFVSTAAQLSSTGNRALSVVHLGPDWERWLGAHEPVDPGHVGGEEDVVLQLYTSGTTGRPKGVLSTNANLGACTASGGPWGFDASSTSLCAMPMFHIGGLGWALVGLANGAHNVIVREVVPAALLDVLEQQRITNTFLVPSVIGMLVDLPDAAGRDYSLLRSIAYGSSPITPALLRRALATFRRPLFQVYGLTETHGAITQLDAHDHDPGGEREHLLRTAGRAYPWVDLKIASTTDGGRLPAGQVGEICVRSQQVTPGYYGQPEATAAAFDEEGWFHTGDVGSVDPDGYLTISDRLKDLIITGGENVYPVEVEATLAEHPGVTACAVIGRPDERWGEAVVAVVVPRPDAALVEADVVGFLRARLAGYKCPKVVELVDSLPLGPTGKVLKRELRAVPEPGKTDGD